jgi:hypothetical protein
MRRRNLRIAILANRNDSYVKPMAEGLQRMLSRVGAYGTVFYDGLERLSRLPTPFTEYIRHNGVGATRILRRVARYLKDEAPSVFRFVTAMRGFDAIVVVNSMPDVFLRSFFHDRTLRALLPATPIVLYDVFYLPTRGPWARWLREGRPQSYVTTGGNWGLERYDWYLCASVVSETPMPDGPQPVSVIGIDLDDGTLRPGPKPVFSALIDFEYAENMQERAVQIQALQSAHIPYTVLHGHYRIDKIREIYRSTCVYFVASRESFGLPICELQACGSYIFTPDTHWCPSHWVKPDLSQAGPGELSPNFVIYHNDQQLLIRELHRIRAGYDPQVVVSTFRRWHSQLFSGNDAELQRFIDKLRDGTINSRSHTNFGNIRGSGEFPFYHPRHSLSSAR